MKELLDEVELFNRLTKKFESADLFREADQKNFNDYNSLWRPMLKDRREEYATWDKAADAKAQDSHWDWPKKGEEASRNLRYETFAIECCDITQGLMLVDVTAFARLNGQKGREIVYIELFATAPWNRSKLVADPKYKGVGRIFLETAISLSVDLGFKGRIGLHSLPQSLSWYYDVGQFTDGDFDPSKKMQYFEMTEAQAAAFISV